MRLFGFVREDSMTFHITVAVAPTNDLLLENEMPLIKAALMYADKATLCSPKATAFSLVSKIGTFNIQQKLDFIEVIGPLVDPRWAANPEIAKMFDGLRNILAKKHPSPPQLILRKKFESFLSTQWQDINKVMVGILEGAGATGLLRAIEDQAIVLENLVKHPEAATANSTIAYVAQAIEAAKAAQARQSSPFEVPRKRPTDETVELFVDAISKAISDRRTYPLFDQEVSGLVTSGLREGRFAFPDHAKERGKHVALASEVLRKLPLFELATIDEVRDIRRELDSPLTRFRAAMIKFSRDIERAGWDRDFEVDAERVFLEEVAPAVASIEDAVQSNKYLRELIPALSEKPLSVASGFLVVMLSQMSELPTILAKALGLGVTTTSVLFQAHKTISERKISLEQNQLYFYYAAKKRLSEDH